MIIRLFKKLIKMRAVRKTNSKLINQERQLHN